MIIRAADAADAAPIAALWNPMIRESCVTFNAIEKKAVEIATLIADRQAAGHAFEVAVEGAKVMGFASYSQFRPGIGYAHTVEHTIVVDPGMVGRGIGRVLMTKIEDHARRGGAHSIFAGVSGENPAGVSFHIALGYSTVAVLPEVGFKFGRWIDLHLMQKLL